MSKEAQAGAPGAKTAMATATKPEATGPRHLPAYKVLLHNDDHNFIEHVVETIVMLTPLEPTEAIQRATEAHRTGCSLILVIHKERAELYAEQFRSRGLTVTIEPAD